MLTVTTILSPFRKAIGNQSFLHKYCRVQCESLQLCYTNDQYLSTRGHLLQAVHRVSVHIICNSYAIHRFILFLLLQMHSASNGGQAHDWWMRISWSFVAITDCRDLIAIGQGGWLLRRGDCCGKWKEQSVESIKRSIILFLFNCRGKQPT